MLQMVCIAGGEFKCTGLGNKLVFIVPEPEHLLCHGKCHCFALMGSKSHLLEIDQLLDGPGIGTHQITHIEHNRFLAGDITVIIYGNLHLKILICGHTLRRQAQILIYKVRITQTMTKGIQRQVPTTNIEFDEKNPYMVPEHGNRQVAYAERKDLMDALVKKYNPDWLEEVTVVADPPTGGMQQMESPVHHQPVRHRKAPVKSSGTLGDLKTAPPNRRPRYPENTVVYAGEQV